MNLSLLRMYRMSPVLILSVGALSFVCTHVSRSEPGVSVKPLTEKHRCLEAIRSLKESGEIFAKANSDQKQVEIEQKKILDFIKTEWKRTEEVLPENQFVRYDVSIVDGFYCAIADKKLKRDAENLSLQCGIEYVFKSNPFQYLSVQIYAPQCPPES
ncbi:hypothetical protein HGB47_09285 [Leptospira yasudae]|uniref:hypothetical protein n=1 Tax=Leptospira yasudae TaxID=2202201 RepID=UPI001C4E6AF0|nr:hypothetical protein [Leptospira yasudae]MBW0433809.1 hypothetical protein [Leptospira yasudae]